MNKILALYDSDSLIGHSNHDFQISQIEKIPKNSTIIDFTGGLKKQKHKTIEILGKKNCLVFSDLTTFTPSEFLETYPHLQGCFSALLLTATKKIEFFSKMDVPDVEKYFHYLGLTLVKVKLPNTGFIYPRILAQIVNEAHFAREEAIATAADIDRAMQYGVNYPQGPFAWTKGREHIIARLLDELKLTTKNKRYDLCKSLQAYL